MPTYNVTVNFTLTVKAANPEQAIVAFCQNLDAGLYDEHLLKAKVEEVHAHGNPH